MASRLFLLEVLVPEAVIREGLAEGEYLVWARWGSEEGCRLELKGEAEEGGAKVVFGEGKSCLFGLEEEDELELELQAARVLPGGGLHNLGRAVAKLSLPPAPDPQPNSSYYAADLPLYAESGERPATLAVYVRFSCLGRSVVARFPNRVAERDSDKPPGSDRREETVGDLGGKSESKLIEGKLLALDGVGDCPSRTGIEDTDYESQDPSETSVAPDQPKTAASKKKKRNRKRKNQNAK